MLEGAISGGKTVNFVSPRAENQQNCFPRARKRTNLSPPGLETKKFISKIAYGIPFSNNDHMIYELKTLSREKQTSLKQKSASCLGSAIPEASSISLATGHCVTGFCVWYHRYRHGLECTKIIEHRHWYYESLNQRPRYIIYRCHISKQTYNNTRPTDNVCI